MAKRLLRLLAVLFTIALLAAACGSDDGGSGDDASADESESDGEPTDDTASEGESDDATGEPEEERTASEIGVTEDTITIGILVADLDPLIEQGFSLPAALSTDHLAERYSLYFDKWNEAGGINGRMIETVTIPWDPLNTGTMENACTEATLDNELFMVINGSGFSSIYIPCLTVDNDMFMFYGETTSQALIDESPNRLFILNPTAEVASEAGVELAVEQGLLPEGEKIGILSSSDNPTTNAAGITAVETLEAAGFETELIEVTTLTDDNSALNAETASSVSEFTARGVGHVFVLLPFTQASGFWGEVGAQNPDWERTILDNASSNCTPFGASRTDPAANGAVCVTAYDSYALPEGGIGEDDEFEAQCRQDWIDDFPILEGNSDPGVPSGEVGLETADGELLYSDYPPGECTMLHILEQVLVDAGVNPTRDSLADAFRAFGEGPQAFRSNGEGSFGPDKNYYSTQMQPVRFTVVAADTPRGEDGTFNGCPAPVNCWIPVTGEWAPVDQ